MLARNGKFLTVDPFFGPGPRTVVSRDKRYEVGDLVLLGEPRGGDRAKKSGSRRPQVQRRLGRPGVARDVIGALLLDRSADKDFDAAVQREARTAATEPLPEYPSRTDLRELATFTIDPVTARDFDDAISAQALPGGGWRVWVHIADVAAYVRPRSLVDREGYRRATSVYVPGTVAPMLPGELSNGACSLVPGEDRPTVTVEMTIGETGVRSASFSRSLIRSDARLDYDAVDRIFAGTESAADPWGEPLAAARGAAAALVALRAGRSAIVLESAEPQFRFDPEGHVVASAMETHTESHRLIEALMIAANEAVARFLDDRKVPTLYRVHQRPEPAAIERLVDQLASLGVPTPPIGPDLSHLTPQEATELAGEISAMVSDWVARHGGQGARALNSLVLRSLKQAYYDDRNLGHAGLASSGYCHFTSPIRRYPDLICHRALLSAIDGSEAAPDGAFVRAAGPWTSTRERAAMVVERDADDIVRCFLLERMLLEAGGGRETVFRGEIVGLIGAGAFVAFGEHGEFQGMIPVRRLGGDWWELNEEGTVLVGTRNGGALRLGDTVEVRVGGIDTPRGRVDLVPADTASHD